MALLSRIPPSFISGIRKPRLPLGRRGWILIEEKYDADKDGKLNEAEMAQLNADASKALEARREARKAARGNNDMPPPPAPAQEEGDDE